MVIKLYTCALSGFDLHKIELEVDFTNQLPSFSLVGLASSMTQESRERVRSAVNNSGFEWPGKKVTVNLIPSDLPKWGSHFELPMALGIIHLLKEEGKTPFRVFCLGELSLCGDIRPTGLGGILAPWLLETLENEECPWVIAGHPQDLHQIKKMFGKNIEEKKVKIIQGSNLMELWVQYKEILKQAETFLMEFKQNKNMRPAVLKKNTDEENEGLKKLQQVEGEPLGVVAALIGLVNKNHHILFLGPQGVGKSMIATAMGAFESEITEQDQMGRGLIDRAFGFEHYDQAKFRPRPVVYLQTTLSRAALEGSVSKSGQALPGEMSRAHGGLLIMDEFLEYRRDVLECLRQPLEEGKVRLQRALFRASLPARFQLVATSNLCPCGQFLGTRFACRCTVNVLLKYQRKLSGPLLDRFDLILLLRQNLEEDLFKGKLIYSQFVKELCDPKSWKERIKQAQKILTFSGEGLSLTAKAVHTDLSRRGIKKLSNLSKTIAALDGAHQRNKTHEKLAIVLRLNIEKYFKYKSFTKSDYLSS